MKEKEKLFYDKAEVGEESKEQKKAVPANVTVISGGSPPITMPLAGKTVKYVYKMFKTPLNIAAAARALIGGREVDDSYILKGGETLEFVRKAGRKG